MGVYEKIKSENYRNFGGINLKASLYITGETEFLNLQNVDFRLMGSLSSFAGSTQISTQSATSAITGVADYYQSYVGSPYSSTFSLNTQTYTIVATDKFNLYNVSGNTFGVMLPFLTPNINAVNFVLAGTSVIGSTNTGALFGCNGWDFFTYQGSTTAWQFSLGKARGWCSAVSRAGGSGGASGFIVMYYSLVRSDGFYGPAVSVTYSVTGETAISFLQPFGPNLFVAPGGVLPGGTGLSAGSFGLSGIQAWVQLNQNTTLGLTFLLGMTTGARPSVTIGFNFTAAGGWALTTPQPLDFQGSFVYGLGSTQGSDSSANAYPYNPYIIEYFANQLFTSGFGGYPSRVVFSNPGTPEIAAYTNFFDVSPNEPVPVSAMKAYSTQLMIWKPSSTYALSGSGADSFVLSQVSDIYGALSSRGVCVWNQRCWFIDRKGICEFDGANVLAVSNKVESYFSRMNVSAAINQAVMIHVKERNEVWAAIPIDGSHTNNIVIVYDYLANAWTTRTPPPGTLTALNTLTLGNNKQVPYYGNASGVIGTFGSSLMGDNGAAFTSIIKTRFIDDLGQTVTKLYRRLYIDASVPPGQTFVVGVNVYADKGESAALSTTMILSSFQNRMDFGIAAKSISTEIVYSGATFLQINGYTIEYRYQRNT